MDEFKKWEKISNPTIIINNLINNNSLEFKNQKKK